MNEAKIALNSKNAMIAPLQHGESFLGEGSTTTTESKDINKMTGHVRDFFIIQSIDIEDDPFGEEALKKINF